MMAGEGQAERDELRAMVKAAMSERTMTAAELAAAAGVTQDTMMKMTKGLPTKNFTARRMREYLAGMPQTEPEPERYPVVIEVVQETVGIQMSKMTPAEQRAAALRVITALFEVEG